MNFIRPNGWDFHCHLDLFSNPIEAFDRCKQERLFTLSMTTTPKAWQQNMQWAEGNEYVRIGLGLHPELVGDRGHEAKQLISMLPNVKFVGEVGIDGCPQYRSSYRQQREVFETIVGECNRLGNKTLSIHSRRTVKDIIEILASIPKKTNVHYILHWFSGSKSQVLKAVELGCYFSINESMHQNDRSLKMIAEIPLDRILTETDEPFRTEAPNSRIKQLDRTVSSLSKIYMRNENDMRDALHQNSLNIIKEL